MSISEKRKAYFKEYFKRPDVKKKQKEIQKKYFKTAKGKEAKRKNNKTTAERRKIDRKLNPEKYRARDKKYSERIKNDPEKLKKRKAFLNEYLKRPEVKKKRNEYIKQYNQSSKGKEIRKLNDKIQGEKNKVRRKLDPEKYKARDKKHRERIMNNPVKLKKRREYLNAYQKRRREADTFFRIRSSLTARLSQFLRISNSVKKGSIFNLIGCSKEFLRSYLEKKFYPNPLTNEQMTWKNYGKLGWEIDHSRPLSDFKSLDVSSISIQKKMMHYSNLQPMWRSENRSKSDLIYLLKPSHEYKKTLFFKEFNSNSTLKDLDEYVKKKIRKFDPDLEIELSVARNSKRQYLVWIKSKLEN